MKNIFKIIWGVTMLICFAQGVQAAQFEVLVLPTGIFSTCSNYFCFPDVSEIIADDVITNLNEYNSIKAKNLSDIRRELNNNDALKFETENMLNNFEKTNNVDFKTLKDISQKFNVKSVLLISSNTVTPKNNIKRNLWEVLEISNAFKTTTPYILQTTAVLTDNVNDIVMWSSKYSKTVTDSNGFYLAQNQAQAASQLEKIKLYSKNNISQNISQNIHLRFFPKDVRTFSVNKQNSNPDQPEEKKFVPNALEHLITPQMIKELDEGQANTSDPTDDFIFEF